jgi:GDPmannose 4,6-dehydratase
MKVALVTGVSGQDGGYLAKLLLEKGYAVFGTSRDAQMASFRNLVTLGIKDRIRFESVAVNDFRSVLQVLTKVQPDEVYNLAGQSSVGLSFEQPIETQDSIYLGTLNLLEAVRFIHKPIKIYNAASSECFGDVGIRAATEETAFRPRSPYAVAKSAAFWQVANYREAYGLFACSGILFNHESPLRPERFVTQKIARAAVRIAAGLQEKLILGNVAVTRDWGWAPEYVEAMYLMLQRDEAEDFVIATGQAFSLESFVEAAFAAVQLDWQKYLSVDKSLFRPSEIMVGVGDPQKAKEKLGWEARHTMRGVARMMVDDQLIRHLHRPESRCPHAATPELL